MKYFFTFILAAIITLACSQSPDPNKDRFASPDKIHYPETWFHFINNNVSIEGITADLEAISQAGISGVQFFHGRRGDETWPGVGKGIAPLSENWDDAVKHIARECERLGLNFTIQNCPGWAMAGGPWIEPKNAMRALVNSRTDLVGKEINVSLPMPANTAEDWRDYTEVAVLAFPTPEGDTGKALKVDNIKGTGAFPWEAVFGDKDGRIDKLPISDEPYVITMDLVEPSIIRTIELPSVDSFNHHMCYDPGIDIKAFACTSDGKWHKIVDLSLPSANWQDNDSFSIACPEVGNAVAFRLELKNYKNTSKVNKIRLYSAARKNSWESEAGLTLRAFERTADDVLQSADAYVARNEVIDITSHMAPDGRLVWTAPENKAWTILRIGHVNEGKKNSPAPPEGTGWECDKLSVKGPEAHFKGYVGRLMDGALQGGLLDGMLLDSWECSTQMWTAEMEKEFSDRCGYALRTWLPALFGYVMDEPQTTSRFLLDWRGTVGELITERFYKRMVELAHERGLKVTYETAAGDVVPSDIMEYFKYADVPMCEFWQPFYEKGYVGTLNYKPIKPTASASRLYGKSRVAAESFTSFKLTWNESPAFLKEYADYHFVEGVTYNVFHTYTHNPQVNYLKPGTSFGANIGSPFLRGQTWWPYMKHFTTYLARCSYMLEQGRPVSAVLWYLGDEISHKPDQEYDFPEGYKYDYCNPDVLLNRLKVKKGKIVTPEGLSYELLWIPENKRMKPETLERIYELVKAGAKVVANPPRSIATLIGGEDGVRRFDAAVEALWGGRSQGEIVNIGKGKLLYSTDIEKALNLFGLKPDVKGDVRWIHREGKNTDWYFVTPEKGKLFRGSVALSAVGKVELWDAITGESRPVKAEVKDGYTVVDLDMPISGSCFIVIDGKNAHIDPQLKESASSKIIGGTWNLTFPSGWGVQEHVNIHALKSWCELPLSDEAKAFSGTVKYTKTFALDASSVGREMTLDLGEVSTIADVTVNGTHVGTLWCKPYALNIGDYIREGENVLEIDVTGTWYNRLVYDASLPESDRKTWVIKGPNKNSKLVPYGLLGPVMLRPCGI